MPVELRTVFSPYRELTNPILEVIDELDAERPDDIITVVIPEFVVEPLVGAGAAQPERAWCCARSCANVRTRRSR